MIDFPEPGIIPAAQIRFQQKEFRPGDGSLRLGLCVFSRGSLLVFSRGSLLHLMVVSDVFWKSGSDLSHNLTSYKISKAKFG